MANAGIVDVRGLSVSGADAAAVERLDAIIDEIYYYRPGVQDRLDALLDEYPDFSLAHVLKGYSLMTEGTLDAIPAAQARLVQAQALPATTRERLHQEALRAWIAGDPVSRAGAWQRVLVEWPIDLLALRQYTGTLFWDGDKRHQAEVIAGVAGNWAPGIPGYGHYLSAHAFAMEEIGLYGVAERSARAALDIQSEDLWALHALAHVLEMQDRFDEGIEVLGDASGFLNNYNLFRGHLWWHLALFMIARSRFDEALQLFDREIYPKSSGFYLDIQNGASVLARLEFQGVDVGPDRWERLALGSLPNATQSTIWFTSMHHVMALTRSGRVSAVQATLDYLGSAGMGNPQADLAYELSRAAEAFYQGRHGEALERLLETGQRHGELGASHAQQDLYDQFMVMSALELGELARVRQLLKARLATKIADEGTYRRFEEASKLMDTVRDANVIRAALRWEVP